MKRLSIQIALGVLIIGAGVLLLLEAIGAMTPPRLVWAALLAVASAAFWFVFFADRPSWWAALPAAALLGGAAVMLMELDPAGFGQWTEIPFLAAMSIGFWAVYLRDTRKWWALIPAGMLLTLAVVAGVAAIVTGPVTGAIFLFGAALTFGLVAMLPGGASTHRWAWIPAGALVVASIIVLISAAEWLVLFNYLWPLAVIGAGTFLIVPAIRRNHRGPEADRLTDPTPRPQEIAH